MDRELLQFPESRARRPLNVRTRIARVAALMQAIDAGELFAALPDCPVARRNHLTALSLLAIAETEISALSIELGD